MFLVYAKKSIHNLPKNRYILFTNFWNRSYWKLVNRKNPNLLFLLFSSKTKIIIICSKLLTLSSIKLFSEIIKFYVLKIKIFLIYIMKIKILKYIRYLKSTNNKFLVKNEVHKYLSQILEKWNHWYFFSLKHNVN